jgi:anti-sigma factor RsiW
MITEHPEIGTIQAFLDGELSHEEASRVTDHIGECDTCAAMLAEAEDELAMVFPALAREFDTLVPTQRLWSRINESIAAEPIPLWARVRSFVMMAFANPSIAAAASVLIVFGVFAVIWMNRLAPADAPDAEVAFAPAVQTPTAVKVQVPAPLVSELDKDTTDLLSRPRVERAAYRSEPRRLMPAATVSRTGGLTINAAYLPGEESYVKTIESLSRTVNEKKQTVLRPSQQVAFERDLAVVNDAIARTKREVRKNPRNGSAKQVLYSSYQNKIDLLNSVSQQEELIASIK